MVMKKNIKLDPPYNYASLPISSNSVTYDLTNFIPIVKEEPSISEEYIHKLSEIRDSVGKGECVDIGDVENFAKRYGL